jgi:tetratricopeptide (TPR) repeat protein
MAVVSTIALGIISNLVTDLLNWTAGGQVAPLDAAIQSTASLFPGLEGVEDTLRQWLQSVAVSDALRAFVAGEVGRDEFPVEQLASILVEKAGFYLPEHSEATAEKIISTFLVKVRSAYLTNSPAGLLHVANRQEARFDGIQQQLYQVTASVDSAGGLRPALQTHFDQALARLEAGDYPAAKALFETLLTEFERAPLRDRHLERRIRASLGQIAASLGDNDGAINHYKRAIEMDDDPVRAAVNSAVVDLIEQKPDEALGRLASVSGLESSSVTFEYSAVKVEALLRLKRHQEAVDAALSVRVAGKETQQFELIGRAYRESGALEAAEKAFRAALAVNSSRAEAQYFLAEVLFTPAIEYRNQHPGMPMPAHLQKKLEAAANLLEGAAASFRRQGRNGAAAEVESTLAVVRSLQDRFADSIRLLEPIVKSADATANDWRILGFAYVSTNEPGKAVDALKCSIAKDPDPITEFLYAQALIMAGRADDALAFAQTKATEPITADNVRWHITKANALGAKRQFSKAREVLTTVRQQDPTNAEVLLTLAELYEATGDDAEAANAYEQALKNATGADETRVRYMFGGFSARRKEHGRAVELWRPLLRREKPNTLLDNYLRVLYNSRGLSEITSIAENIRKSGEKASAICAEVAAATYQRLDDLNEASSWLEYLCDNYGNKPEYITQLSTIKFRLGRRDEAMELLDASKVTLKDAKDLMGYAQAYSMLGRHRDAIELGRRAVLLATDPDIYMGYVGVFLAADDSVEKTPEEISTFQEVFSTFKERFPTSSQLQSFTIDPDRPLDAIRDTLIKLSEQTQDVVTAYRENRMPLQMFANLLGRDLYDVWLQVVADPELILLTAAGTDEEQEEFQRILGAATSFILDAVSLFTFSFLGLIEKLQGVGDLYVAQSTLDDLHELQAKKTMLQKRQTATMGMVDGTFFMQEFTPGELEKMNAALNAATAWSEAHAKAIGLKEPLTSDDQKWVKPLGSANVASIVIAKQRGYVLLTDDKTLGDIGKHNYGTSFVNSQAVLLYLLSKGLLSRDEYDKAILKLVEAGYTFTRIDEGQLFGVIVDEQFQITPRLKRVFRALEPATIVLPPACSAVAGLLRRIYLEPVPKEMRDPLAFYILDTLAKNHSKMDVQRLMRAFLRQQMRPLLVLQLRIIEQLLDRW